VQELAPGLWHWSAQHPHIRSEVSSYFLANERALLDPMLPSGGARCLREQGREPEHVVLTNRHHDRDAWRLRAEFGCEVHCIATGPHELDGRGPATPFEFGDELPGVDGLTFVPDWLMDEPEQTKQRLRESYRALLELEFDRLLLAHGAPVTSDAKAALKAFVDQAA
jgi:glyoxylase-like metal-dependent hydrolase (beta-lactamase superfamily II)